MTEVQIAAVAGEHFVAHKIAMLGLVPVMVDQRLRNVDLLVSSETGSNPVAVQIRSAFHATRESATPHGDSVQFDLRFPLNRRAVALANEASVFCFVDLKRLTPSAAPDVYVLTAQTVREELDKARYRKYAQTFFEMRWNALQPFRNNWDPLLRAVTPEGGTSAADSHQQLMPENLTVAWDADTRRNPAVAVQMVR